MARRGTPRFSIEPSDPVRFTRKHDRYYTLFAGLYDKAVRHLPVWKTWLARSLPYIKGPRVLEISFGTGHLLTRYAGRVEAHGIDYNRTMVETASRNLSRSACSASLVQANVESLPYRDGAFDSLVNTMAFSGYPDAGRALGEMKRVLRPGGRLVLIDFGYPADGNRLGTRIAELWKHTGDLIRDMGRLFEEHGLDHRREEIGGAGSVHLYLATRPPTPGRPAAPPSPAAGGPELRERRADPEGAPVDPGPGSEGGLAGSARRAVGRLVSRVAVAGRFPDVASLAIDELVAALERGPPPMLLDAREPEEFAVSHLPGAANAPSREAALERLEGVPPHAEIVVYCSVGWRSARLARELRALGYERVRNLEGSIFAWANRGLPLHRAGRPTSRVHPYDGLWGRLLDPERRAPRQARRRRGGSRREDTG